MRQVFLEKGAIVIKEVSRPLLDDHSVLVCVEYSFISSGTEIATMNQAQDGIMSNIPVKLRKLLDAVSTHGIDGTKALIKTKLMGTPQAIGYSCSGKIIAIGNKVKKFQVGDLVACAGAGMANHAEIVCVPENLVAKVHDEQFLKHASLTTIGAIAMQGIRRAQLQLGETVCVLGLGLLGQITVQLAKLSGCTVVGLDLILERLQLAASLGADYVYNPTDPHYIKEIEFLTQHHGVDTTIITAASSSNTIIQQAMEITRRKGKVVLVGDVGLNLSRDPLYKKEIDFLISCSYGPGRYDTQYEQHGTDYPFAYVRWTEQRNMQAFVQLIEQNKLLIDQLISHQTTLEHVPKAYEQLKNKTALGILIQYNQNESVVQTKTYRSTQSNPKRFIPAQKEHVRVGIVGAGGFAKVKLMPTIAKLPGVKINAVVDADISSGLSATKVYGATQTFVHDSELFSSDIVDVVIIASPHKFHCDQALRALEQGKAVFMEKPMVTDYAQFLQLKHFLSNHPDVPFCVDYNRSFAPYIQKIKQEITQRHSPLVIHYRMNAGFIAKDHWIQSDIGAGRILGEACHIFDLFCYLTDSKPIAVSVESVHGGVDDVFPTDNFSAQISFQDGSICTLLYTSLGHTDLGKERMELFFDSKTIVMDDYNQLHGFGFASTFNETTMSANKGHEDLLREFFTAIRQPIFKSPISIDRLNTVAELTLIIDALACEGGGKQELNF